MRLLIADRLRRTPIHHRLAGLLSTAPSDVRLASIAILVWPLGASILIASVMIVPLWLVQSPGMMDYPAHLASYFLIAGGARLPPLSGWYAVNWQAIPNLGFEAIVPPLAHVIPIAFATKLLLSVALACWALAPQLIHRALFGRFGIAPLASTFFAFNDNYMLGFLNYFLAAGLALLGFAAWIATENWRTQLRVPTFAIAMTAIYFCHLFGAVVLGLLIGLYECSCALGSHDERNLRALSMRLWPLVLICLPAAALLLVKPHGEESWLSFDLASTFRDRFKCLLDVGWNEHNYLLLGILALLTLTGLLFKRLVIHPRMLGVLIAIGVLALVVPDVAMGGRGIDIRLPPVTASIAFASLGITTSLMTKRLLAVTAVLVATVNSILLTQNWSQYDAAYQNFRAAMRELPRGTRILTATDGHAIGRQAEHSYVHMADFSLIDRDDYSPLLFAWKGQSIVRLRHETGSRSAHEGLPPDTSELGPLAHGKTLGLTHDYPYLQRFQCKFDAAVVITMGGTPSPVPSFLHLRQTAHAFDLYEIDHASCPRSLHATLYHPKSIGA